MKVNDTDFIASWREVGGSATAVRYKMSARRAFDRRRDLEQRLGIVIKAPTKCPTAELEEHPARLAREIEDGIVLIGSDSHYWPGIVTAAHRAFVKLAKELQPKIIIKNGDVMDLPSASRHATIGWESRPTVADEIEATKQRLSEIEGACLNAELIWPLGNHDARFETRLATQAPEFAKVHGVHLKDHFPRWRPCWSTWINDDTVIKHRFKSGIHAPHNNAMWAGKTIVTGHLHSLKVMPLSDYNGTRWGVDCGTLADPYSAPFVNYTEDNPVNWRSGFVVLTFHRGELLWPEVVHIKDVNHFDFRGQVVEI
jgi:hypothetical protein